MATVYTPGTPTTVVQETSGGSSGWMIFFIIIIILIIILVAIFFFYGYPTTNNIPPIQNVGPGGICTTTQQCAAGLNCIGGICVSPIGGTCSNLSDCISGATACFNGICVNTPLGGIGQSAPCQSNLTNQNGICKVPIGGTCSQLSDCVSSAISCLNNICVASSGQGGIGQPPPCQPGLIEHNGICLVPSNGRCTSNSNCISGNCSNNICVNGGGRFNSKCYDNSDCYMGLNCYSGKCKIPPGSAIPCCKNKMCGGGAQCLNYNCTLLQNSESDSESSSESSSECSSESTSSDCNCEQSNVTKSEYMNEKIGIPRKYEFKKLKNQHTYTSGRKYF